MNMEEALQLARAYIESSLEINDPDPSHYSGLAFIGPIPKIRRVWSNGTVYYVNDWKKLSPAAKARVEAEINYVEDCCFDRKKL